MSDFSRVDRVSEQIKRELAELIRLEVSDPRVTLVTITDVQVARDFSHAKVYFTRLDGQHEAALEGLQRASGFLRRQLGRRIKIRLTPELIFKFDQTLDNANRLSDLIDQAVSEDQALHQHQEREDNGGEKA